MACGRLKLRGSCGLEYKLFYTDKGKQHKSGPSIGSIFSKAGSTYTDVKTNKYRSPLGDSDQGSLASAFRACFCFPRCSIQLPAAVETAMPRSETEFMEQALSFMFEIMHDAWHLEASLCLIK